MTRLRRWTALVLLCVAPAATPVVAAPAACPDPSLKRGQVTIFTATGRHRYRVEIAATPSQQQCGLMFRRTMPRGAGMVFPMGAARPLSFWMQNTYLPLDIIFVGRDGRVVNAERAVPMSQALVNSAGDAASVVELNAGEAARIGLKPGDAVRLAR